MPLTRLILIRHGQAEAHAASRQDFDRALTDQGREDAAQTGRRLAEAGFVPDLALVSAAVRASQTWDAIAPAMPGAALRTEHGLYNAGAPELLAAAQALDATAVAVVAHNPGLHALAFDLAARGAADPLTLRRLRDTFPPGCAAVFWFEDGRAVCEAFLTP